ncbi:MAG: hypothetical protein QOI19_1495 [Thermoleophilaceae bacterium]|nr:hypothetical protein [Thermoleophilaceae bacterium]
MIDAVILTSNSRELALRCVAHTVADPAVARVILVDNASSDGTAEAVQGAHPEVEVLALAEHTGLAAALNRGAERGTNPYVLYLNDDVFAANGAIAGLLAALEERPDAAAAGGRLTNDDLSTQDQYRPRSFPGAIALSLRLLGIDRWWPANPLTGTHLRRPLDDETTVEADQPAGACLLVRRSAVDAVGGWDERYWFWYEDVDFSRRVARDAGATLYVPSAPFRHLGGATTTRWSLADQHRRTYYGMLLYAQSHLSRAGQLLVAATMATVCLLRVGLARVRREEEAAVYRGCLEQVRSLAAGRPVARIRA